MRRHGKELLRGVGRQPVPLHRLREDRRLRPRRGRAARGGRARRRPGQRIGGRAFALALNTDITARSPASGSRGARRRNSESKGEWRGDVPERNRIHVGVPSAPRASGSSLMSRVVAISRASPIERWTAQARVCHRVRTVRGRDLRLVAEAQVMAHHDSAQDRYAVLLRHHVSSPPADDARPLGADGGRPPK